MKIKHPIFSINPDLLKIIALTTMTIDHLFLFFPTLPLAEWGRFIGRISFPIFSFLLITHLYQKQIYVKYLKRLGLFGILSFIILLPFQQKLHIPLTLPFNILISFFIVVLTLWWIKHIQNDSLSPLIKKTIIGFSFLGMGFFSFACQYSLDGFLYLIAWYFYLKKPDKMKIILLLLLSIGLNTSLTYGSLQGIASMTTTAFLLMLSHPKKNYPRLIKNTYIFYIYYPLHLAFLATIALYIK